MRRSNHSRSLCLSPEALCGILPQIRHRHPLPGLRREHVPFCGILSTGRTKTPHHKSLSIRNKIFSNSAHTRQPSLQQYAPIRVRSRRYQKNSSTCITLDILSKLKAIWQTPTDSMDGAMLWASACIGFFGFLRAGEFTVPSPSAYDPEVHLNLADIAIDSHTTPSLVCLRIKQSKTDPFREGVEIFVGTTGSDICPVSALIQYLAIRSPDPGPLFIFKDGTPLTRSALVSHLQAALQKAGFVHTDYNGHSFRIGAATTAA